MKTIEDIVKLFYDNIPGGFVKIEKNYNMEDKLLSYICYTDVPNYISDGVKTYTSINKSYINLDDIYSEVENAINSYYVEKLISTDDLYKILTEKFNYYEFTINDKIDKDERHKYSIIYGTKYWTKETKEFYHISDLHKAIIKEILEAEKVNGFTKKIL